MKKNNKKELEEIEEVEEIEEKETSKIKKVIKELIPYVIILVVVILIRTFLVTPVMVNGRSMVPTLDGGEIMLLNKIGKYDRFDVVVVDAGKEDIIKRIIALPGESISCSNGIVYVNERRQDEEYSKGITSDFDRIVLKDNEYFVMGDNREDSLDSRILGPFTDKQIRGTSEFVLFPFSKFGKIK